MSVMWHLVVDHDTVGPAYQEMRSQYDGPVTIAQDLTVFNITRNAVVVRQAIIDPVAWPVIQDSGSSTKNIENTLLEVTGYATGRISIRPRA